MTIVDFIIVALEETLIMKYLFRISCFEPHFEFFYALQGHRRLEAGARHGVGGARG